MQDINWFKVIMISFFVIFIVLYLSQSTGYYEFDQYRKMKLTEDKIKEFEQDVKEGKNIDVTDYIESTVSDYHNKASKSGLKFSKFIENSFDKVMGFTHKLIENLFIE
jgi:hypothetical protein